MADLSISPTDDPQDLLSSTRDLTRRVRLMQRGAWFPLLVFATVTLAAAPFYRYGHPHRHCTSLHAGTTACVIQSTLALWYWPVALLGAYIAISWFYVHRAHQRGVGSRVLPYIAVGAVLALLVTAWALWADAHPGFLADTLRLGPSHPVDFFRRVASPAGAIGLALLLLARIERSWTLFSLSVVYLAVNVVPIYAGSFRRPTPWVFLPHLLLTGSTLLIGGIILALIQRDPGSSPA
jgi:hypothetical protein